jgi:hypothetical protein
MGLKLQKRLAGAAVKRFSVAWRLGLLVVWTVLVVFALWCMDANAAVVSATPVWAYWLIAHVTPLFYVLLLLPNSEPHAEISLAQEI